MILDSTAVKKELRKARFPFVNCLYDFVALPPVILTNLRK